MLGTRTKQVNVYGRKRHRIVNVDDEDKASDAHHIKKGERAPKTAFTSPARRPLSAVSSNLPSSPVPLPRNARKKRKPPTCIGRGTPPFKLLSPVVNVDIVILDDEGQTISQERRVSRTDVQANPNPKQPAKGINNRKPSGSSVQRTIVLSDDDEDEITPPQKPVEQKNVRANLISKQPAKWANNRKPSGSSVQRAIVLSDDDEDDIPPNPIKWKKAPLLMSSDEESDTKGLTSPSPYVPAPRLHPRTVISPPTSPEVEVDTQSVVPPKSTEIPQQSFRPILPANALRADVRATVLSPAPRSKARQLTPMRCGARRSVFPAPPSPPTPTTPSDLDDLSFDFSELGLSSTELGEINRSLERHDKPPPQYLMPLLEECSQSTPHEFSAFIDMFPLDPIVQTSHGGVSVIGGRGSKGPVCFHKIGEASFSEVFGIGDVVLKVIPLRDEDVKHGNPKMDSSDSPAPSDAKDVLKEIIVTRAMGEMCNGFVELLRTYVVRGRYPTTLLDLWDEYHGRKGSESVRPDGFTVSQVYAIIVLPNGGPDLEAYTFSSSSKTGWKQACSLFWQVTRTLAEAEDLVHFEHRDLHWGQILVKDIGAADSGHCSSGSRVPMDHDVHGVKATIIDLGLSRMDSDNTNVHWTPFDDEVFEGEGDYQFDVYRMMQTHNGGAWKTYRPLTNVMWLHYLCTKLLHSKRLRPPAVPRKNQGLGTPGSSSAFTQRGCYQCLVEVEGILRETIAVISRPPPQKARRKAQAPVVAATARTGLKCAADVLLLAVARGWVSAS